jgi:hypothetical protein
VGAITIILDHGIEETTIVVKNIALFNRFLLN